MPDCFGLLPLTARRVELLLWLINSKVWPENTAKAIWSEDDIESLKVVSYLLEFAARDIRRNNAS